MLSKFKKFLSQFWKKIDETSSEYFEKIPIEFCEIFLKNSKNWEIILKTIYLGNLNQIL